MLYRVHHAKEGRDAYGHGLSISKILKKLKVKTQIYKEYNM
jgi:hypothetical protein